MRASVIATCLAATLANVASGAAISKHELRDASNDHESAKEPAKKLIAEIQQKLIDELSSRGPDAACNLDKVVYRREYGDLTREERLDYVRAMQCMMDAPAKTPASVSPGAKNRFDDFVVTHIQQTFTAHYSGNFQAWHRWFMHSWEKALRDECGYKGYQPYWDWSKYAEAPQDSPIFSGDDDSMGGNGEYLPDFPNSVIVLPEGVTGDDIVLPRGLGGGLVTKGPFANMTVNLGPFGALHDTPPNPQADGLGYNPRPLKRDVGPAMNMRYANASTVWNLLQKPNLKEYRLLLEGPFNTGEIGPHGGGHYTINGDPGGDFWTAPAEPVFYLHHGMMDRMWSLWQAIDPETRHVDLDAGAYGHRTWNNEPPSPLTTLDDTIDMGYVGAGSVIRDQMSTIDGPHCYLYK
ncbi:hypothetical protein PG989_000926 [Apiospora arundinis]